MKIRVEAAVWAGLGEGPTVSVRSGGPGTAALPGCRKPLRRLPFGSLRPLRTSSCGDARRARRGPSPWLGGPFLVVLAPCGKETPRSGACRGLQAALSCFLERAFCSPRAPGQGPRGCRRPLDKRLCFSRLPCSCRGLAGQMELMLTEGDQRPLTADRPQVSDSSSLGAKSGCRHEPAPRLAGAFPMEPRLRSLGRNIMALISRCGFSPR